MENMFREVSISEEDLEFLNNCIESHINRLKGRIKQLETNKTPKSSTIIFENRMIYIYYESLKF